MRKKIFAIFAVCFCLISGGCGMKSNTENIDKEQLKVTFFDTGKSDCILIESDDMVILNDTADEDDYNLINDALQSENIETINYMILSHFDKDHIGSASKIIESYDVQCIIMPDYEAGSDLYSDLINCIDKHGINVIRTDASFESGKLKVDISAPEEKKYDDDNNYSMITHITYGETSFLLLGDALKDRLEEYTDKNAVYAGEYTIVKLPHHGDYYNVLGGFIEDAAPFTAIITDDESENRIEERLLETLEENVCTFFCTDKGDITVLSDGYTLEIKQ